MTPRYSGTPAELRALSAYVKLMRCTNVIEALMQRSVAEQGMTLAQLAVMEALLHLGPLSQGQLSRKMLRSGGSVSSVVDLLEGRGWVERQRATDDRRVVLVHLTPEGQQRIARVFALHAADIREAMNLLSADEQDELARLCRKLGLGLTQS